MKIASSRATTISRAFQSMTAQPKAAPASCTSFAAPPLPRPDAWYTNTRFVVAMNRYVAGVSSVGSRKPRAVTGSVGDSCTVRGFGMAVRDAEPERTD
jgi:hypothetical protein